MKINHSNKSRSKRRKPKITDKQRINKVRRKVRKQFSFYWERLPLSEAIGFARHYANEASKDLPKPIRKRASVAGAQAIGNATVKSKTDALTPLFKWTGGKRREIKHFAQHFPDFVLNDETYTYVEPFVGAGAVFWHLNNFKGKNIINDFDDLVMNFYEQFRAAAPEFVSRLMDIGKITDHNTLEDVYYAERNKDKKNGLASLSAIDKAVRFFVVNQLAFSGMRRFNADGEFNVPFGHYKGLNASIITSAPHKSLLANTEIKSLDFEVVMKENDNPNTFIFLDPPYTRVFKEYSSGKSFGEDEHRRLAKTIEGMKHAKVMLIIDKSPLTQSLYKSLIKDTYSLSYGVNIKNRFDTAVEHLVVCNY